jgi:hypothetical protein
MVYSTLFALPLTSSDITFCLVTSLVMFTFVLSLLYLARLTVLVRGFAVPHIDHKD